MVERDVIKANDDQRERPDPPSRPTPEETSDLEHVARMRWRHRVPVTEPLVFVSQAPRSGGTLLMGLLDGHPELHGVPHEFRGRYWGALKTMTAEQLWRAIWDFREEDYFHDGYTRYFVGETAALERYDAHPFLLPPSLHRRFFLDGVGEHADASPREVIDAYLTGYFNAWLDYRNLRTGPKRWVTAFCPRRIGDDKKMLHLRRLWPDGRLISVVRDPVSWYASARRWSSEWADRDAAVQAWTGAVRTLEQRRHEFGDDLLVLAFEDLVSRTEATMRRLADWLGIAFAPELLQPTFNGWPIEANSSFALDGRGVERGPLERRATLESSDVAEIERATAEMYEAVRDLCLRV